MESSPLELYEKAYRLHYIEGEIAQACTLYETIIQEFPDSHECGYSVIQLQKISANSAVAHLAKQSNNSLSPLLILSIALNCLCIGALVLLFITLKTSHAKQVSYQSDIAIALSKSFGCHEDAALMQLARAKQTGGNEIAPYAIGAEIYASMQQYDEGIAELASYKRKFGPSTVIDSHIALLENSIAAMSKATAKASMPDILLDSASQNAEDIASKLMAPPPAPPKKKGTAKKTKDVLLREDVTFF